MPPPHACTTVLRGDHRTRTPPPPRCTHDAGLSKAASPTRTLATPTAATRCSGRRRQPPRSPEIGRGGICLWRTAPHEGHGCTRLPAWQQPRGRAASGLARPERGEMWTCTMHLGSAPRIRDMGRCGEIWGDVDLHSASRSERWGEMDLYSRSSRPPLPFRLRQSDGQDVAMCRWLQSAGCDVSLRNCNGHSAVHKAATTSHIARARTHARTHARTYTAHPRAPGLAR